MNKEFSIIIPVYNVANYLDKAIESVLSQNISADLYEIILVDDGSTDASGDKCNQWKNRFPALIKVIHKKNAGLGFARNSGLEIASGEYIIFLDSDDYWIDNDALRKFETKIKDEKPDVVVFKNCIYDEMTGIIKEPKKDREAEITLEDAIKLDYFDFSAWNKAVKRSLLIDNNIVFKKGISEDMLWSYKILLCSKKISFCLGTSVYAYRKGRAGSLTAQKCVTYREEYFKILDDIGCLMKSNENNKAADLYASMVYITLFRYLRNNLNLNEKDVDFVQCLNKNKRMLRCCANWKIGIIRIMICTLGAKNTIALFRAVNR